jgi:hypothetical protein
MARLRLGRLRNATFAPWFEKSANGSAIALNQASAWVLQSQLLRETPERVSVEEGSSSNGFAVLAGRSSAGDTVQVLLNNYQPSYDMIREITDGMVGHDPDSAHSLYGLFD